MAVLPLLLLAAIAPARAAFQAKTLVILDSPAVPQTHSLFFKAIQERGHKLSFMSAKDRMLRLGKFGDFDYDNVILFSPNTEDFGGDFDAEHMMDFIHQGGNAMIIVNSKPTETNREVSNECGVDFDEEDSAVIDHLNYDELSDDGTHTKIIGSPGLAFESIIGKLDAPVVFSGLGQASTEGTQLVFPVLTASATGYSDKISEVIENYPQSAGTDTLLVSAVQARNNARISVLGSPDMFSNKFFMSAIQNSNNGKKFGRPGNEKFAEELTKWTFHEKGSIRAVNLTHFKLGNEAVKNPSIYRVKDDIVVQVVIQEYIGATDSWAPLVKDDIQIQLVMMDPYVRRTMEHVGGGVYKVLMKAPDVYGCYKIMVDYERVGYSRISISESVSVRPFRHDEYPRFLVVAWPYYASAFSMMGGVFIFGVIFLYGTFDDKKDPMFFKYKLYGSSADKKETKKNK